ncbi:NADP-dependent aldehyde dehydrogenase [Arthrobacter sp. UYEF6]
MALTGHSLIGGKIIPGEIGTISGINPATNEKLEPSYSLLTDEQLKTATAAAADAFDSFSNLKPEQHALLLETIATNIETIGDELILRAASETGLPAARLQGERTRTTHQLRHFASVVRRGDFRGVRIDSALPDRAPLPRADIRQRQIPLGPVAVFGASNFPLAFSTAGGDTASALAAGCPVVFKAHNAHPGTSELTGQAIVKAVRDLGLHPGVFSLVYGPGNNVGKALVADPVIKAVGFTGSRAGGTALTRIAAARPEPIPVYAEMSSINPVFVLPGVLHNDIETLADQYVTSLTGSSGQMCTVPGLLFVPVGAAGDQFASLIGKAIAACAGQTMLSKEIALAWESGVEGLASVRDLRLIGRGTAGTTANAPAPAVFGADLDVFTDNLLLHEEIFGAASLLVRYKDLNGLIEATNAMDGQLTASVHLTDEDYASAAALFPALERKVGRIIVNGWPTGVEVGHAMVHGGPFPATSDSRTTSVGTTAVNRFLRPVAYQNFPQQLLPETLHDDNPWTLNRLMDGIPETSPSE